MDHQTPANNHPENQTNEFPLPSPRPAQTPQSTPETSSFPPNQPPRHQKRVISRPVIIVISALVLIALVPLAYFVYSNSSGPNNVDQPTVYQKNVTKRADTSAKSATLPSGQSASDFFQISKSCNTKGTICLSKTSTSTGMEMTTQTINLVQIDPADDTILRTVDSGWSIVRGTHSYFISPTKIIYQKTHLKDGVGPQISQWFTYDFESQNPEGYITQTPEEYVLAENQTLFDVTNDGWFVIRIANDDDTSDYIMRKNDQQINLGTTTGWITGISPSGKYGTLVGQHDPQTKQSENPSIVRYEGFSVFPIEENGIDKAIYLGDAAVRLGGIEGPVDRTYSTWSDDETEVKESSSLLSSEFFKNPLK